MRKMKRLSLLLIAVIGVFSMLSISSCQNKSKQADENAVLTVDEVLAKGETLTEKDITIEGVCTHTCAHGGRKIFLMGEDDSKTIRIEAGEGKDAFSKDCVNSMVSVKGKVMEERIDEEYLMKWEEGIKAKTAEKHGEDEAGCETEKKALNETPADSEMERIDNFRKRIAEEKAKTGKAYLSFFYIVADSYEIK